MSGSLTPEETILLQAVADSLTPIGARAGTRALTRHGIKVSESTVSRIFRKLDAQDLTRLVDAKGRALTPTGRRLIDEVAERDIRDELLRGATEVTDLKDLLDHLHARRGIEREAARAAATNAREADVARLQTLVDEHQARADTGEVVRHGALEFHRIIAGLADNRLLSGIMDLLYAPALQRAEAVLDLIIGSHRSEQQSIGEHLEIVNAIIARDPDRADAAMAAHISRLIAETEQFAAAYHGDLVERLFTFVNDGSHDALERGAIRSS